MPQIAASPFAWSETNIAEYGGKKMHSFDHQTVIGNDAERFRAQTITTPPKRDLQWQYVAWNWHLGCETQRLRPLPSHNSVWRWDLSAHLDCFRAGRVGWLDGRISNRPDPTTVGTRVGNCRHRQRVQQTFSVWPFFSIPSTEVHRVRFRTQKSHLTE